MFQGLFKCGIFQIWLHTAYLSCNNCIDALEAMQLWYGQHEADVQAWGRRLLNAFVTILHHFQSEPQEM